METPRKSAAHRYLPPADTGPPRVAPVTVGPSARVDTATAPRASPVPHRASCHPAHGTSPHYAGSPPPTRPHTPRPPPPLHSQLLLPRPAVRRPRRTHGLLRRPGTPRAAAQPGRRAGMGSPPGLRAVRTADGHTRSVSRPARPEPTSGGAPTGAPGVSPPARPVVPSGFSAPFAVPGRRNHDGARVPAARAGRLQWVPRTEAPSSLRTSLSRSREPKRRARQGCHEPLAAFALIRGWFTAGTDLRPGSLPVSMASTRESYGYVRVL